MRFKFLRSLLCLFALALALPAATIDITGTLPGEDQRYILDFTVGSSGPFRAETFNDSINGFMPVLSLFRDLELFGLGFGMPGEAVIDLIIPSGNYRLVLTVFDNLPNGPTYDDGFTRDGQGAFTQSAYFGDGPWYSPFDGARSGDFALRLTGDVTVPEPSTLALTAVALIFALKRKLS